MDILKVADKFDRLTAMNINHPPVSEVSATTYLMQNCHMYSLKIIAALAQCIHILPTGACVDLSDGEKALVLQENPDDFRHPMVLKFNNNMIYDLSDPIIGDSLHVTDIMKTMDNRIAIDEETLKHFVADQYIKETADKFRRAKIESARIRQQMKAQVEMESLLDSASILPDLILPEDDKTNDANTDTNTDAATKSDAPDVSLEHVVKKPKKRVKLV